MALFGKKEKQGESQRELDMLVTTTENIGRPYEVLGLVTAKKTKIADYDPDVIVLELTQKAREKNADAIVGFKYETYTNVNITNGYAYGTAVKFK
ncbi:heavy metal-binding domain-containing protein [Aneurinibacillus aneurinilyticus]|uniref:heavy metal-binding domain-containing protein n=1 Tax=Aneurinibacillus aneurinilyticus TaxID=1391 RepID=UPI003525A18C